MKDYINIQIIERFICIKVCDNKWIKVNDSQRDQYSVKKNLRFKTLMLRSDLCDYSDVYFVIKRRRTVEEYNDGKTWNE